MGLLTALARDAASNARASLVDLRRAVDERRLTAPIDHTDGGEHGDLEALTVPECELLLAEESVGRVAYIARSGTPDIAPVNYVWVDGGVLVRSGPGPKLQAADRREIVAFEIDRFDEPTQTGWSVVLVGRAQRVPPEQIAELVLPEPWANGPRRYVIRIEAQRISGRRIL
jgi:hypothetical protein